MQKNQVVPPLEGRVLTPPFKGPVAERVRNFHQHQNINLDRKLKDFDGRHLRVLLIGFEEIVRRTAHRFDGFPVAICVERTLICQISGVRLDENLGLVIEAMSDFEIDHQGRIVA